MEEKMETLNVGVIGCGSIGVYHIENYQKTGKAEVVAVCDVDENALDRAKAKYGVGKGYKAYEDLLDRKDVDAVSVCLPNYLHAPVTVAAFKAGKHVLCEKPMAMRADESMQMIEARDAVGKRLMLGLTQRFRTDAQLLRKHIQAGELGEIYYAKCGYLRRSGIPGMGGWFTTRSQAGAGPIYDIGVHALDLTLWLMDNFKPVSVLSASYAKFGPSGKGAGGWGTAVPGGPFDVEDLSAALIRMENGAAVFLEVSWAGHVGAGAFYSTLLGDQAGADLGSMTIFTEEEGNFVDKKLQFPQGDTYLTELTHFVDCILEDKEPITKTHEMIGVQKALDGILTSAEKGEEVKIR